MNDSFQLCNPRQLVARTERLPSSPVTVFIQPRRQQVSVPSAASHWSDVTHCQATIMRGRSAG